MHKTLTILLLLVSSSVFSNDGITALISTKQFVKTDLWLNGIQKTAENQKLHQSKSINLDEEVLIPLLKLEKKLKITGQS